MQSRWLFSAYTYFKFVRNKIVVTLNILLIAKNDLDYGFESLFFIKIFIYKWRIKSMKLIVSTENIYYFTVLTILIVFCFVPCPHEPLSGLVIPRLNDNWGFIHKNKFRCFKVFLLSCLYFETPCMIKINFDNMGQCITYSPAKCPDN